MFLTEMFEDAGKRLVVIYPGRFQPFHKGHADVFASLQARYGSENVFIVTSNKTDALKSPFNFSDKVRFMHAAGIPDHSIIESSGSPYDLPDTFKPHADRIVFIAAVGAPDARRLHPGALKKDGTPGYFLTLPDSMNQAVTADQHGYVVIADERAENITIGGKSYDASHGTQCRELWNQVRDNPKQRAEFLQQLYGKNDPALGHMLDKIPTGAPEPKPKPSPKLKKVKDPKPVDEGAILTKDELMDIYLSGRGKFPGSPDIRRKVATGVPLNKVEAYIDAVAKKFNLNPKAFVYGPPRIDESQAMLTEELLREAFLDSVVKFLGNKAREIPQQINNLASSLQLLYGVVSDPQRLRVTVMLLKRELQNNVIGKLPVNIRAVVRFRDFLQRMVPQGATLKDFFTLLLVVAVGRTGLVIADSIKDIKNEALLDPIIDVIKEIPQFANMIATQGGNALGSALQALKIGNTLWFEILNKIKAGVDWASFNVGLNNTSILTKFPKANQPPPAPPAVAEEAAGVGVVKGGNDPRYVMATMGDQNDVTPDTLNQMMRGYSLVGKKSMSNQKPVKGNIGKGIKESEIQRKFKMVREELNYMRNYTGHRDQAYYDRARKLQEQIIELDEGWKSKLGAAALAGAAALGGAGPAHADGWDDVMRPINQIRKIDRDVHNRVGDVSREVWSQRSRMGRDIENIPIPGISKIGKEIRGSTNQEELHVDPAWQERVRQAEEQRRERQERQQNRQWGKNAQQMSPDDNN